MPIARSAFAGRSVVVVTNAVATTFPATENPISQSGLFIVGTEQSGSGVAGPQTTGGSPGMAFSAAADGVDYAAFVQGRFTPNKHYSQVTIRRLGGYVAPSTQEVEVHVGGTFGSGVAASYEFDFWFGGTTLQPVRWNATPGSFDTTVFTIVSGSWPGSLVDGDVIRIEFDSTSGSPVFKIYLNNVLQITYTDTTAGKIMSGSPGFGFFVRTGTGVDLTGFCIKSFSAGSL